MFPLWIESFLDPFFSLTLLLNFFTQLVLSMVDNAIPPLCRLVADTLALNMFWYLELLLLRSFFHFLSCFAPVLFVFLVLSFLLYIVIVFNSLTTAARLLFFWLLPLFGIDAFFVFMNFYLGFCIFVYIMFTLLLLFEFGCSLSCLPTVGEMLS